MLVDANLLLYSVDSLSPHHRAASDWLSGVLNGAQRVGIPWQSIGAFMRISTHPRIMDRPLTGAQAWEVVDEWLAADPVWIPPATERTARVLGRLMAQTPVTGNLVPDVQMAALALEHGLTVYSADTDFARFPDVRWVNPLEPAGGRS